MIERTQAITLRHVNYGETSQIVTLFTRERGKLAVMAKGARKPKSPFGSTLQPMAYAEVVYYYKPTRSVQTLSESAHVSTFGGIGERLDRLTVGQRMMELVEALLRDEEQNEAVFQLTVETLARLDAAEERVRNVLPFFQLRLACELGVAPAIEREAVEALPPAGGVLALESGAVLGPDGSPEAARRAGRTALRAYAIFARASLDDVMRLRLREGTRRTVEGLIDDYLRYQFEASYPTRSARVAEEMASWQPG